MTQIQSKWIVKQQKPCILDTDLFQNTVLFSWIIMEGPSQEEQN